jgi:hypothetical protein
MMSMWESGPLRRFHAVLKRGDCSIEKYALSFPPPAVKKKRYIFKGYRGLSFNFAHEWSSHTAAY